MDPVFRNNIEGTFVDRPHRFAVRVACRGRVIEAHCPNPGRMQELLYPGATCILETSDNPARKLANTLVATVHDGNVVPLHSLKANAVVKGLVIPLLFPAAEEIRSEYTEGSSRFDFFLKDAGDKPNLIEVKHCSLIEHGIAMFPDAPSSRALKHVHELTDLTSAGSAKGHIIFLISHGDPETFVPNVHTDPSFSFALQEAASKGVAIHCVSTKCSRDGNIAVHNPNVGVSFLPLSFIEKRTGFCTAISKNRTSGGQPEEDYWNVIFTSNIDGCLSSGPDARRVRIKTGKSFQTAIGVAGSWSLYPVFTESPFPANMIKELIRAGMTLRQESTASDLQTWQLTSHQNPFHITEFRRFFFSARHWAI